MAGIGTIVSLATGVFGAMGSIAQAEAAADQAEYEAAVREKQANLEQAMGQRKMLERRRQKNLQQSRLRAVSSKSSGSSTDPTTVRLGEGIDVRGRIGEVSEYQIGAMRGDSQRDAAAAARIRADNARTSGMFGAIGNLLGGAGKAFSGGSIASGGASFTGPSYMRPAPISYYKDKNNHLFR